MSLLDTIKKASVGAVQSSNPVAVIFGTVKAINPLSVNVDQRFTLTEDFLVVTNGAGESLGPGDKVVLLRVQGGHQYVVLDKVGS